MLLIDFDRRGFRCVLLPFVPEIDLVCFPGSIHALVTAEKLRDDALCPRPERTNSCVSGGFFFHRSADVSSTLHRPLVSYPGHLLERGNLCAAGISQQAQFFLSFLSSPPCVPSSGQVPVTAACRTKSLELAPPTL